MRTPEKIAWLAVAALLCLGVKKAAAQKLLPGVDPAHYLEMFVQQGSKTYRLHQGDLTFRTALTLGPEASGYYGLPAPPRLRLDIRPWESWSSILKPRALPCV